MTSLDVRSAGALATILLVGAAASLLAGLGVLGADEGGAVSLSAGAEGRDVLTATVGPYRPTMVLLPAGRFIMGSPETEPWRAGDEAQREVVLSRAFYLGATEVTEAQWSALMGENRASFASSGDISPAERRFLPVEQVSWWDTTEYLNRLSTKEGFETCYVRVGCEPSSPNGMGGAERAFDRAERLAKCASSMKGADVRCLGYRLPTEAEWEYAARAGTTGPTYAGAYEFDTSGRSPVLDAIAWHESNSGLRPHRVGTKRPNGWLLYDMLGNVWEWTDGKIDPAADVMVARGCGFGGGVGHPRDCRAANRGSFAPYSRFEYLGFRPARSVAPPSR